MDEHGYVTSFDRKYATTVMLILASLVMIVMYVEGMLTPSLPAIQADFGVTQAQVSLVLASYMIGGVALTPVAGKLGDIYGKKKILTVVILIYAIAVATTGFSPNFTFMVISRGIQGIGMAIMPLGMSLVREEFPKDMIPKAQSIISAMFGAGFAVSLPLGSFVSNDLGWRWTYHSAVPVVFVLAIVSVLYIRESRFNKPEAKVDIMGATILALLLTLLVLSLSEGSYWGWTSLGTIAFALGGLALIAPLIYYELDYSKRGGDAIINFKLLARRNVLVANVALSITGLAMFLAMQALTYRFIYPVPAGFGLSILDTGLSLIPFAIGMIIFGPITGILVNRTGVKKISFIGALVTAFGFLLQATLPDYVGVLVCEFVTGAGMAILNASVINLIVLTVNPREMGIATALNGTFRSLGSSIGAPVAGSMLSTFTAIFLISGSIHGSVVSFPVVFPASIAYEYIFAAAAVLFLIVAVATVFAQEVLGKSELKEKLKSMRAAGMGSHSDSVEVKDIAEP